MTPAGSAATETTRIERSRPGRRPGSRSGLRARLRPGGGPVVAPAVALVALLGPAGLTPAAAQEAGPYHPFQQGVEYRIEATVDEATHVLSGRARLRYTNHAPEALERLYFHQYLNAFRPNSAWAEYDLRFGDSTYQDLGPEEHGFERITDLTVAGDAVDPVYPASPDSTVFFIALPEPLESGRTVEAIIDWEARLSTEPRRQGREGRHYNWAHWYPRIAVYGADGWEHRSHIRPGEFNGSFGSYDVTMELQADQVVGATGVPVHGDPGWESAMAEGSEQALYLRDFYGGEPADLLGLLEGDSAPDRKRIRWRAEEVHNFAWSSSPDYRYLGGRWQGKPIHLVWRPANEQWDPRATLSRQQEALDWIVELFGEYAWPQITVTDRVEGRGATEYPMLYMTRGGAVVHETMHMVAHGILANNEWREGWLDEGMASFLTSWLREEEGADPERLWGQARDAIAAADREGRTEPVGLPGASFSSYPMYSAMTYGKGELVLRMLRDFLGEEVFRTGLREYYEANRFRQVTGQDFRRAMEHASGRDLGWFFRQWIETTDWLDYGVADVNINDADSGPVVTVELVRNGPAWMPVVVQAGDARVTVDGREQRSTAVLEPTVAPDAVVVDPDGWLLDADRSNNRWPRR